tara:strand:- start:622 stop:927 length:306 start_codon:yes stop_codon:yes gene_type:complete
MIIFKMLDCKLCGEVSFTRYICDDCNFIKDCINIYSKETVIDVIKRTLIRDDKQRTYKIDSIVKERLSNELNNEDSDESYIRGKHHDLIKEEILSKFGKNK